jgi:hypothetical protein
MIFLDFLWTLLVHVHRMCTRNLCTQDTLPFLLSPLTSFVTFDLPSFFFLLSPHFFLLLPLSHDTSAPLMMQRPNPMVLLLWWVPTRTTRVSEWGKKILCKCSWVTDMWTRTTYQWPAATTEDFAAWMRGLNASVLSTTYFMGHILSPTTHFTGRREYIWPFVLFKIFI